MTLAVSPAVPNSRTPTEIGAIAVSVIIPVRNGAHHLIRTMPALRNALPRGWEIIVVDDASTDASREVAMVYADRVVPGSRGKGAPTARNRGAEVAGGNVFVFLDADIRVSRTALLELVKGLESPGVSLTFGIYSDGAHLTTLGGRFKSVWVRYSYLQSPPEVRWMNTAIAAIRRSDFEALGGYHDQDDWLHGGNDIDFGRAVADRAGTVKLLHGVQCDHLKELSLAGLLRNDFFRTRGFFRTAIESGEIRRAPDRGYGNISPAFMGGVLAAGSVPPALLLGIGSPYFLGTAAFAVVMHTALSVGFYRYAFPRLGRSAWSVPAIFFCDHLACFAGLVTETMLIALRKLPGRKRSASPDLRLPIDSRTNAGPRARV